MATPPTLARNAVTEVTINGFTYQIEALGSKTGKKLITLIARTVGPAFDGEDHITKFCAALKDDDLDWVCDTLAKNTRYSPEGEPDKEFFLQQTFDKHFSARYGTMVLWLKACLEANFGNFLPELGIDADQARGMLAALMASAQTPATPLTGASGGASLRNSGA